ncbi:MAG TPA: PaaI family thioesterase [Streptosporangiaceae bacterium]|nr:PaaI family thioesterase [Streptosporangiaceae bacterium]
MTNRDGPRARDTAGGYGVGMGSPADLEKLLDLAPFARTIGMRLISADRHEVVGALDWSAGLCTAGGVLHGGALMALADTAGALCAFLNLPEGAATSTIESKTNFFRAITRGQVRAVARPLHVGGRTIVVRTELSDESGRPAAHVVQTQAVLGPAPERQEPVHP